MPPSSQSADKALRVAFLHPDLGIGGAERLVVDAAVALKQHGHHVDMYTSHCDPGHCYPETQDGTLFVRVLGDWLPRTLFGGFHVVFAIVRSLFAALWLCLLGPRYDVIVVDQLSISIPLLKFATRSKILFYCHFPDLHLTQRRTLAKRVYRLVVDFLEEITTGAADRICVNSKFTLSVFEETFQRISSRRDYSSPDVLYPSINFSKYDAGVSGDDDRDAFPEMFLSINRFERKKNIGLAIRALAQTIESHPKAQLVVAGGYDTRVAENVEHYDELVELASSLGLSTSDYPDRSAKVVFLRSFSEQERTNLLDACQCVVYTPAGEHFGIVPIEAMYTNRPVIALRSGGPKETVLDGRTGLLCDPDSVDSFASAMHRILSEKRKTASMRKQCRAHVVESFGFEAFSRQWNLRVRQTFDSRRPRLSFLQWDLVVGAVLALLGVVTGVMHCWSS